MKSTYECVKFKPRKTCKVTEQENIDMLTVMSTLLTYITKNKHEVKHTTRLE